MVIEVLPSERLVMARNSRAVKNRDMSVEQISNYSDSYVLDGALFFNNSFICMFFEFLSLLFTQYSVALLGVGTFLRVQTY